MRAVSMSIVACLTLYLLACTKNKGMEPSMDNVNVDSCSSNKSYSANISIIIQSSCAISGCHVEGGFKDFSTYSKLKSYIDEKGIDFFMSRIKPGGGMPPSYSNGPKSISSCELSQVKSWLEDNYENN